MNVFTLKRLRLSVEIGELVTLKKWCKHSGRTAIIIEIPDYINCAKIMFLDNFEKFLALKTNLTLLETK